MSVLSNLAALIAAKLSIYSAIVEKGGVLSEGDGFASFAQAISNIPSASEGFRSMADMTASIQQMPTRRADDAVALNTVDMSASVSITPQTI